MNTVTQFEAPMTLDRIPMAEDGLIDFQRLAIGLVESCLNSAMEMAVDEITGESIRRNGYRERKLKTVIGEITLRIPKLREGTYFPEEVLRPYSRTDRAMIGTVAEVYKLGLSTRKIEKAAIKLQFGRLSSSAISRMTSTLDSDVLSITEAEFSKPCPYLWLDATYISCRNEGRVESRAVVTAIAADTDGKRRYVGLDFVDTESFDSWREFLRDLRARGISGVALVISDAHTGLRRAIKEVFPGTTWQRCIVHLERDIAGKMKTKNAKARATSALSAIFKESDPVLVRAMYAEAIKQIGAIDTRAAELLEDAREDALAYLSFPAEHRIRIRTNNIQERANREIKRRTNVVQVFPSVRSLLRLIGAALTDQNEEWSQGFFMDAEGLSKLDRDATYKEPSQETKEKARILIFEAMEEAA